jgi:hypothetical protein
VRIPDFLQDNKLSALSVKPRQGQPGTGLFIGHSKQLIACQKRIFSKNPANYDIICVLTCGFVEGSIAEPKREGPSDDIKF